MNSEATVNLITCAVDAISRDNKIGRAEAHRRSMVAIIDKGESARTLHLGAVRGGRRRWCSLRDRPLDNPSEARQKLGDGNLATAH